MLKNQSISEVRERLRIRGDYVNSVPFSGLHQALAHFFRFLKSEPQLVEIIERVRILAPNGLEDFRNWKGNSVGTPRFSTDHEFASFALSLIEYAVERPANIDSLCSDLHLETAPDDRDRTPAGMDRKASTFRATIFEPLVIYLLEELSVQQNLLSLIKRYKHQAEWFDHSGLLEMGGSEASDKESKLVLPLYKFLFQQGVEFSIEPSSLGGRIDIIGAQSGPEENRLMVEAKVFRGKSNAVSKGYTQLRKYLDKYSQPIGFLFIYNTMKDQELLFEGAEMIDGVPALSDNGKTVFFIVANISGQTCPSKSAKPELVKIKCSYPSEGA